jgi:hypothetical protein
MENTWNRPIWHAEPIQSANPVWIFLLSGSPSSAMRFPTHREVVYDVIDSSWVSIIFQSRVFRFYSTDCASGRYYMSSQKCSHFFALVLMHRVLLAKLLTQISTSFVILVPRMCLLYHNFYCTFSCYLLPNYPGLKWLNSCVNLTEIVQWSRLALSEGSNWVGVFRPPLRWGREQIQFPKHRVF